MPTRSPAMPKPPHNVGKAIEAFEINAFWDAEGAILSSPRAVSREMQIRCDVLSVAGKLVPDGTKCGDRELRTFIKQLYAVSQDISTNTAFQPGSRGIMREIKGRLGDIVANVVKS